MPARRSSATGCGSIVAGEELTVFGDGLQKRDFNYVDDAVDAFLLAAARKEAHGKVYNLGDSEVVSPRRPGGDARGAERRRLLPHRPVPRGPEGDRHRRLLRRLRPASRHDLGWEPRIGLDEGLRRSIDFYREQGDAYWT